MSCLSLTNICWAYQDQTYDVYSSHLDLMYCYKNVWFSDTDDFLSLDLPQRLGNTHISCSNHVVLVVFVVIYLLNVMSTCGIASHHLFVFLLCHLSDEQYVMTGLSTWYFRLYHTHVLLLS